MFLGIIIIAICIGVIFEEVYGWLFLGVAFILGEILEIIIKSKKKGHHRKKKEDL